jgi:hypothetical protein
MSMHMIHGVQVHGNSKSKPKKLDMAKVELAWRKYNKEMRSKHMHRYQFETLQDYVNYITGKTPKQKKEFVPYEAPKQTIRDSTQYPSRIEQATDSIPGAGTKVERPRYTGDLIIGIGTMHKSNLVPIMRGTSQAIDIANMRR